MSEPKKQNELKEKVLKGLDVAYENLIAFKKLKNSKLVIMRGDKIVEVDP